MEKFLNMCTKMPGIYLVMFMIIGCIADYLKSEVNAFLNSSRDILPSTFWSALPRMIWEFLKMRKNASTNIHKEDIMSW